MTPSFWKRPSLPAYPSDCHNRAAATSNGSARPCRNLNGKLIRLLVDDEPFDLRYGKLARHERTLDLRSGALRRVVEWVPAPPGTGRR